MLWSVAKEAAQNWASHKDSRQGAALAYYSVFSIGPLIIIAVAIAGFVFGDDAVNGQVSVAAATDLILGLLLLLAGALVATGRVGGRRRTGTREPKAPKDTWAQRALREPRLVIAAVIGAICGLPGALYATGLKHLITGTSAAAAQIIGVILFNLIMFSLVLIPFALLEARPEATKRKLQGSSDWLLGHARQLIAYTALAVGAYMVINGAAHLLG